MWKLFVFQYTFYIYINIKAYLLNSITFKMAFDAQSFRLLVRIDWQTVVEADFSRLKLTNTNQN